MKFDLKENLFRGEEVTLDDFNEILGEDSKKFRKEELTQLARLINICIGSGLRIPAFERIFFNYKIEGLRGGELDLIKINESTVINIEFKDVTKISVDEYVTHEQKLERQLKERRVWLSVLERNIVSLGYICTDKEDRFYILDHRGLKKLNNIEEVLGILTESKTDFNIDNLSVYLNKERLNISPINDDSVFIENKYELTDQQATVVNDILNSNSNIHMVKGKAGTGKSLVAFLLAEELSKREKRVILFFMADNSGLYKKYKNEKFKILTLANSESENKRFEKIYSKTFDVLIIDEAQRLSKKQIEKLKNKYIDQNNKCKIIFFLDPEQSMISDNEGRLIKSTIEKLVENKNIRKLNKVLRFNQDMEAFIRKIFNMPVGKGNYKKANVNIVRTKDIDEAKEYTEYLKKNYNYIALKPLQLNTVVRGFKQDWDGYKVIGKEFDNIIIPLDKGYLYSKNGLIVSEKNEYTGGHNQQKLLYEIFTRVKNELTILVIDNEQLYKDLTNIMK